MDNLSAKIKKVIEIGIYLLVLTLPWQTRRVVEVGKLVGGWSEYMTYSLYGTDILLMLLIFSALLYFQRNKSELNALLHNLNKNRAIIVGLLLISSTYLLFADEKLLASYAEFKILMAIGFFWLVGKFAQIEIFSAAFVVSLILPSLLALWQFFSQSTFENKWLGLADHQAAAGGTSVIETFSEGIVSGRWLRAYGCFDHPNILGAVFAVGLLVALELMLEWKKYDKSKFRIIFVIFCLALLAGGLFVSFSRSAWFALSSGVAIMAGLLFFQKKYRELKNFGFGVLVIVAIFSVMYAKYEKLVNVRVDGGTRLENLSVDQRKYYIQQSEKIISANPLLGVGPGNYIPVLAEIEPRHEAWAYQPVHNVFLLIWAELGIIGLLIFIFAMAAVFRKFEVRAKISIAIIVAMLPFLLLDHWLWSSHFGTLFFALILSLMVGFSEKKRL